MAFERAEMKEYRSLKAITIKEVINFIEINKLDIVQKIGVVNF